MSHRFLSDEWIDAALDLHVEYAGQIPTPTEVITLNQVVTDTPFGPEPIELHVDTSDGFPRIDRGHLENADATVTTDYATALAILVTGDQQQAMTAFMSGKISIEGDVAKLLAMQASAASPSELQTEIAERLRALTSD